MILEVELRKVKYFSSLEMALEPINHLQRKFKKKFNILNIKYFDSFRIKNDKTFEKKTILEKSCIFFDGIWFQLVKSEELPYASFQPKDHEELYQTLGLKRNIMKGEHRYELQLSKNAKIYAFQTFELQMFEFGSRSKYGLTFEYEFSTPDLTFESLEVLKSYRDYYLITKDDGNFNFSTTLSTTPLQRKTVLPTNQPPDVGHLKARKYNGIFGNVICSSDVIWNRWEDNTSNTIHGKSFQPGVMFSAERMSDGNIVLLDVISVSGVNTYRRDVRHVLMDYLPTVRDLPEGYSVQKYYSSGEELTSLSPSDYFDGIIYHTFNDLVYKHKILQTVELLYENGYLKSFERRYPYSKSPLKNGCVYECTLDPLRAIKERPDRVICNTSEQINLIADNL